MHPMIWIGGILLGAVVSFVVGYGMRAHHGATRSSSIEQRARQVLEDAGRQAEAATRAAVLKGDRKSVV